MSVSGGPLCSRCIEMEAEKREEREQSGTLEVALQRVLHLAGGDITRDATLAEMMRFLGSLSTVPPVSDLVPAGFSRRTFNRRWAMCLALPPRRFLAILRYEYAKLLVSRGHTCKDAAMQAGYSSVNEFYRANRAHGEFVQKMTHPARDAEIPVGY